MANERPPTRALWCERNLVSVPPESRTDGEEGCRESHVELIERGSEAKACAEELTEILPKDGESHDFVAVVNMLNRLTALAAKWKGEV